MKIHANPSIRLRGYRIVEVGDTTILGYKRENLLNGDVRKYLQNPENLKGLEKGGRVVLLSSDGRPHEFEAVVQDEETLLFDIKSLAKAIKDAYESVWDFHYGLVFLTEDGVVITCNRTFYEHSDFKAEDVEGRLAWDAFGEWAKEVFEQLVEGRDIDGEFGGVSFRIKARLVEFYNRKIVEVLVRTTEEEKLRSFERSFGSLDYPVVVVRRGEVFYQNRKATELFGENPLPDFKNKDAFTTRIAGREYAVLRIPGVEEVYLFFDLGKHSEIVGTLEREVTSYREMVEKFPDVIVIVSSDATVKFVNPPIRELGYEPEEVVGRKFLEFLPQEYLEDILDDFIRFLRTGVFIRGEVPIATKQGERKWVDVVGSILKNNGDLEVLVILRDVTEKVRLQKKLEESEKLYRTLVESSLATIFVIQDDRVVYCNPEFERFTGYSKEEWAKMDAFTAFDRVGLGDRARENARRALKGEVVRTMSKYMTKDGEIRYAEFVITPILYNGRPAALGNAVDITDIKRSEIKLRKINMLLSVASDVNRCLSRKGLNPQSLEEVREHVERLGFKIGISVSLLSRDLASYSAGIDARKVSELVGKCTDIGSTIREDGYMAIPIIAEKVYGAIVVSTMPDAETLETLKALARDIGLAARNAEMEEIRKAALKLILDNLNHFDTLADRLRNPLAAIKGFIELGDTLGDSTVVEKVSEHADRIERILDELRAQEIITYRMLNLIKKL